jgi:hypothetical protein
MAPRRRDPALARRRLRDTRPVEYLNKVAFDLRQACRTSLQEVQGTDDVAVVVVPAAFVGAIAQWMDTSHVNLDRENMPKTEMAHALRAAEAWFRLADFESNGVVSRPDKRKSDTTKKGDTDHA